MSDLATVRINSALFCYFRILGSRPRRVFNYDIDSRKYVNMWLILSPLTWN